MKEKQSFLFYKDWADIIKDFPDDVQLELLQAIIQYAFYGIETDLQQSTKIAFRFIKPQIDRDTAKYIETVRKNTENGKKGGAPIGNNNAVKQRKITETTQRLIKQPKQADNDNDNDNEIEEESKIPTTTKIPFKDVLIEMDTNEKWKLETIKQFNLKGDTEKIQLKNLGDSMEEFFKYQKNYNRIEMKTAKDGYKHYINWLQKKRNRMKWTNMPKIS